MRRRKKIKILLKHMSKARVSMFAAVALLFSVGLMLGSCGEEIDDFNSEIQCRDFCAKDFECKSMIPTDDETNVCVNQCRNHIEIQCGNEHQAVANAQIEQCVDMGCVDFFVCMVFDANPQCYGFVGLP
jgi:hypothetical protein